MIQQSVSNSLPRVSLFVYGTLMAPEVLHTLLEGTVNYSSSLETKTGWLRGYQRFPVREHVYPGIVPFENDQCIGVRGLVLFHLTQRQIRILDWFEDVQYERRQVTVELMDDGQMKQLCQTYVWINPQDELHLDRGDWDYEMFRHVHLKNYLQNTVQPCVEQLHRLGYYSPEANVEENA